MGCSSLMVANAQCKISPSGMNLLQQWRIERSSANVYDRNTLAQMPAPAHKAIISIVPGTSLSVFDSLLTDVEMLDDNIILADLPIDKAETVAALPEVLAVDFGRVQKPSMNYARVSGDVDAVVNGFTYKGVTHSYDGTGVVAGLMDTGLDPNHANFRTADGSLRVARVWSSSGTGGNYAAYTTPSAIASFSTDTRTETHGTHVAGIMAGSYSGQGRWVKQNSADSPSGLSEQSSNIPYKGVAPGATLAMSGASILTDANVINGVSNIVKYAEQAGMPCVVKKSLGSNIGPHDGTDPYSQSLAALAKRAVICLSAGNEGDLNMSIVRSLTKSKPSITTFIKDNESESGVIDIWGENEDAMTVSLVIYDTSSKTYTTLVSVDASTNGSYEYVGNDASYTQNAVFNAAFTGYVALSANVATYNNRFNVNARLNVTPRTGNSTKLLGVEVTGSAGQKVYMYGSKCEFTNLRSVSGSVAGTPANSINDAAAAPGVISVGSYNSRLYYGILRSGYYGYYPDNYTYNDISPFSSYGDTFQGVTKPDLCAPGCGIVSSISTPYFNAAGASESNMSASATVFNRSNYWMNMQGTSMSCPFVSGVVALWLQADPTMKYDDVMAVIDATCKKDVYVTDGGNSERWGAGKVDALAGIKYVLDNKASLGGIVADEPEKLVFVTASADGYDIYVAGETSVAASLFDISGREVARVNAEGNTAFISTSGLQGGVYILCVDTPAGRYTQKIAV